MFDWNDARYFLAVARSGSALAAARTLDVNQTTVTRRIEAMEQALGLRLFERGQQGSRMTEAAQTLLPAAERLEAAARQLSDQAGAHVRGLSGAVRVTTNEPIANLCLMPALPDFHRLFPDIRVQVIVDDRALDLWKGEADVAIRGAQRIDEPTLISRRVADVPWAIYASRTYVAGNGRPRTAEELNGHVIIGGEHGLSEAPAVKWMIAQAPSARVQCLSNTVSNMFQAIKAGLGCGPLPRLITGRDPDMVECLSVPWMDGVFMLTTPALRDAPRVRAFIDFMAPNLQAAIRQLNEASAEGRQNTQS